MSSSRALNFAKIAGQLPAKKEFLNPGKVRIILPGGFPYEAFNGSAACVKPWSIVRMVETSRSVAFNPVNKNDTPFMDVHKLYQNYLMFVAGTKTDVSPQLYDMSVKKGPLRLEVELANLGTKSFNVRTSIFLLDSDTPMCVNYAQSVIVSNETRRPAEPPAWWREKFSSFLATNCGPLKLPRLNMTDPPLSSDYSIRVPFSDVDAYFHMNWSNTIKHSYDAYIAYLIGQDRKLGYEFTGRNVKSFSASYIKESTIGDRLSVSLWRSSENNDLVYFQLLNESSEVTNECSIEFYPLS